MSWIPPERGTPKARLTRYPHSRDPQRAYKLTDYYDDRFLGFHSGNASALEYCQATGRQLVIEGLK